MRSTPTLRAKRFGDELERIGWKGDEAVGDRKMHAFFELHIEQGPILEAEGKDIGVVTHGQGLRWIQVHGDRQGKPHRLHADADAQECRARLARITELVHTIAMDNAAQRGGRDRPYRRLSQFAQHHSRQGGVHGRFPLAGAGEGSTGWARFEGGGAEALRGAGARDRDRDGVGSSIRCLRRRLRAGGARRGGAAGLFSHMDIVSGAGHDACWINRVAPTAMVMCPCVDGLSHNEAEEISPEWAEKGANVLFHAVVETAEIVG
jgi:N-carbamoyl-L-amino-acid hydrolase